MLTNSIDQIGQNVQIMKRTYKSNHLYEVFSTLTCYKLKDNPTGSSNWLVSGKYIFKFNPNGPILNPMATLMLVTNLDVIFEVLM